MEECFGLFCKSLCFNCIVGICKVCSSCLSVIGESFVKSACFCCCLERPLCCSSNAFLCNNHCCCCCFYSYTGVGQSEDPEKERHKEDEMKTEQMIE